MIAHMVYVLDAKKGITAFGQNIDPKETCLQVYTVLIVFSSQNFTYIITKVDIGC